MFTIRFPIPLSSLTSLVQGMKNISEPSFITLRNQLLYTNRRNMIIDGKWYEIDQSFISTPHFFPKRQYGCPRLYVQTEMSSLTHNDHDTYNTTTYNTHKRTPESIREILQIEECEPKCYSLLVHTEKEKNKKTSILFHKKYYVLSEKDVQKLIFK